MTLNEVEPRGLGKGERGKGGDRLRLREVKYLIQGHTARTGPAGFNPKAYNISHHLGRRLKGRALPTQQFHILCPAHLSLFLA